MNIITQKILKNYKNITNNIKKLRGFQKRLAIGSLVSDLGGRCISSIAKILKVSRNTVNKGLKEYLTGIEIKCQVETRGKKSLDKKYPDLHIQIVEIIDEYSQINPTFKNEDKYVRITIKKIRELLIQRFCYTEENSPKKSALNKYINNIGYKLKR